MQYFIHALDSCECKAIYGHLSCNAKIDCESLAHQADENYLPACTLLELKNMTTYERVKSATTGPVTNTHFELKMLCLVQQNWHNIETAVIHEKQFYFSLLCSFFFISIPNMILGLIDTAVH